MGDNNEIKRDIAQEAAVKEQKVPALQEADKGQKVPAQQNASKEPALDNKNDDSDIEEMTVEELSKKEEKPVKKASEKRAENKKKRKQEGPVKRFWKKRKGLIIFLIIVAIGVYIWWSANQAKKAIEEMVNKEQTEIALIERQDIRDNISITGTIVSPKVSQVISSFRESTKITNVYYEVGDHVNEGDIIVTYSTDNIEKSIANTQEDIATSKKKAALDAQNRERTYINTYGNEASSIQNRTEAVDYALKALYDACDGYGDAKRDLQNAKDEGRSEAEIASLEARVSAAYQTEQNAQKNYNDAVNALADANRLMVNNLASAEYQKDAGDLSAGDSTKNLERQLETYQDNLEDYIVTAPISGIVTKVDVEEGNGFTSGNVMTIQRDDVLDITTEVDEYDINSVEEGQKVLIKTEATGDDELEGVVTSIAPTATSAASAAQAVQSSTSTAATYTVKIEIKNKDDRLKLGMSAKTNIITDEHKNAIVVRYDAIEEAEDGSYFVKVVDNSGKGSSNISVVGVDGKDSKASDDKKPGFFDKFKKKNKEEEEEPELQYREVTVQLGIVGDYYTEIISDEISEGMQVVVQSKMEDVFNPFEMMMGGGR